MSYSTLTTKDVVGFPSCNRWAIWLGMCLRPLQIMEWPLVSLSIDTMRMYTDKAIEAYQPISPIYEASVSRAYPSDLQPPPDVPQTLGLHEYSPGLSGPPCLVDSVNLPAFTEQHPILQPERQTPMRYQAQDTIPKLETSTPFMKMEKLAEGEDFQHHNLHTGPIYMYSANSSHSVPEMAQTDPGFYRHHNMERYQTQYPTSHGFISTGASHQQSFEYFPLASQTDDLYIMTPNQKKPAATKRGPFKDPQKRLRTAQTRKMGSCIRCRMQRIRVSYDSMPKTTDGS